MKNSIRFFICFFLLTLAIPQQAQILPAWQEGYLDIHQICTGRGNSAFLILPDGTTLLIDAGDLGDASKIKQEILPAFPNDSRLPGEWIARYINYFSQPLPDKKLDYVFLTHHHNDHVGSPWSKSVKLQDRDYALSGITEVAEYIPIGKLVDRGWPDYDYPSKKAVASSTPDFNNYLKFIHYQSEVMKTKMERFNVGSKDQFVLLNHSSRYPDFCIRNIYSSGRIWTGTGDEAENLFPSLDSLTEKEYPNENICSSAIKLSYGKFNYFSGGDITGAISEGTPKWRDVETPVGRLVGPVDVAVTDHHSYSDGENESIISLLRPQVFIIPVWDYYHPQPEVLERMINRRLYPDDRLIFATSLVSGNVKRLGKLADRIKPGGHIVVRVYPGGKQFKIFVLDPKSVDYKIIYETEMLYSKEQRSTGEAGR